MKKLLLTLLLISNFLIGGLHTDLNNNKSGRPLYKIMQIIKITFGSLLLVPTTIIPLADTAFANEKIKYISESIGLENVACAYLGYFFIDDGIKKLRKLQQKNREVDGEVRENKKNSEFRNYANELRNIVFSILTMGCGLFTMAKSYNDAVLFLSPKSVNDFSDKVRISLVASVGGLLGALLVEHEIKKLVNRQIKKQQLKKPTTPIACGA